MVAPVVAPSRTSLRLDGVSSTVYNHVLPYTRPVGASDEDAARAVYLRSRRFDRQRIPLLGLQRQSDGRNWTSLAMPPPRSWHGIMTPCKILLCQPTRPITCANHGNHIQIIMKSKQGGQSH